jgi:rhamnopyranosyl-N-acetylglucosaminyl-diphospho-decaprenol beta-1,3/1,4-galactofuranosyltransferase
MTPIRVAAVTVTYNRSAVLTDTLHAARAQTRPPDRFYVVDNASIDRTPELLRAEFPDVAQVPLSENLGPSGGLAHGIQTAWADGFDAFWLMDDDSPPEPGALDTLLAAEERGNRHAGIVGCRGGVIRFGLIRHLDDPRLLRARRVANDLYAVDFVLLDGSLVSRRVVDVIGVPREDYFTMMHDVEYPLRAQRAGFEILVTGRDLVQRQHLGSARGSALWRGYYQSRNHVRMAIDLRSPSLFFGCMARQARLVSAALRASDGRWERVKLQSRGVWDGLRGRMGRRVEPAPASR